MSPEILAQHMGQLHAYEHLLVFALAFGPFIVLGLVVYVVRRRDLAEDASAGGSVESSRAEAPDDSTSEVSAS